MRTIPIVPGEFALVDEIDFDLVCQYKWRASKRPTNIYVMTTIYDSITTLSRGILMHRLILQAPLGTEIDHIDGNGLNNQRANLRYATRQQNNRNRKKHKCGSSQYKGVSLAAGSIHTVKKWRATIYDTGRKKICLGTFETEIEAALAYDNRAKALFGAFARLNFP